MPIPANLRLTVIFGLGSFAVAHFCPASASAALPPPGAPLGERHWKATLQNAPSSGVQLGSFRVSFQKTTLGDVQREVGGGMITHQGDAGESVYSLCYTVSGHGVPERLWIRSSGEMGGAEHQITGVSARLSNAFSSTRNCPSLPERLTRVRLDHQVWLNSTARDVLGSLGTPSHREAGWSYFDYEGKAAQRCEGGFYALSNSVALRIEHGLVTGLEASQASSC